MTNNIQKAEQESNFWDQIEVKISINQGRHTIDILKLAHDLKGAAGAFNLLVDELETGLTDQSTPRQRTKVAQLKQHAFKSLNALSKLSEALNTYSEKQISQEDQ